MALLGGGIDISKHNGNAEAHIKQAQFVLIRAGYGKNHIDSKFYDNVALCEKYDKPYGVYWFSYACNVEDAAFEAIYMLDAIRKCSYKPELPVFIDWEEDSEKNLLKNNVTFTFDLYNKFVTMFCKICEICGYFAGVYADKYHYTHLGTKSFCVWLAWWNNKPEIDIDDSCIWIKQYAVDRTKNLDLNVLRDDNLMNIIRDKHFNGY